MSLDVYLVPVGEARFELYSEHEQDDPPPSPGAGPAPTGWWQRQMDRFRATLAEAEQERRQRDLGEEGPPRTGLWRAVLRRIAETIAEQRLLWQLRNLKQARLVYPDLMPPADALKLMRSMLAKDLAKHRRRCVFDAAMAALLGPLLFFVPGPNVIAYYFVFLAIGHLLALRGASHGLSKTVWDAQGSGPVQSIAAALALPRAERRARLGEITATLGLKHLTGFVERVAARPV